MISHHQLTDDGRGGQFVQYKVQFKWETEFELSTVLHRFSEFKRLQETLSAQYAWVPQIDARRLMGSMSEEVIETRRRTLNSLLVAMVTNKLDNTIDAVAVFFPQREKIQFSVYLVKDLAVLRTINIERKLKIPERVSSGEYPEDLILTINLNGIEVTDGTEAELNVSGGEHVDSWGWGHIASCTVGPDSTNIDDMDILMLSLRGLGDLVLECEDVGPFLRVLKSNGVRQTEAGEEAGEEGNDVLQDGASTKKRGQGDQEETAERKREEDEKQEQEGEEREERRRQLEEKMEEKRLVQQQRRRQQQEQKKQLHQRQLRRQQEQGGVDGEQEQPPPPQKQPQQQKKEEEWEKKHQQKKQQKQQKQKQKQQKQQKQQEKAGKSLKVGLKHAAGVSRFLTDELILHEGNDYRVEKVLERKTGRKMARFVFEMGERGGVDASEAIIDMVKDNFEAEMASARGAASIPDLSVPRSAGVAIDAGRSRSAGGGSGQVTGAGAQGARAKAGKERDRGSGAAKLGGEGHGLADGTMGKDDGEGGVGDETAEDSTQGSGDSINDSTSSIDAEAEARQRAKKEARDAARRKVQQDAQQKREEQMLQIAEKRTRQQEKKSKEREERDLLQGLRDAGEKRARQQQVHKNRFHSTLGLYTTRTALVHYTHALHSRTTLMHCTHELLRPMKIRWLILESGKTWVCRWTNTPLTTKRQLHTSQQTY
jgi:hypothetical protein